MSCLIARRFCLHSSNKVFLGGAVNYSVRLASNDVINLAYDVSDKHNSKKALVIGHGLFAGKATWRAMARRVNDATKHRVYTVDLRNHGLSTPFVPNMTYQDMATDLSHFIQKTVIEQDKCESVSVMGHSMGGKTAMTLVLSDKLDSSMINKLIVADIAPSTSPSLKNITAIVQKLSTINLDQFKSVNLHNARKQIDQILCELDFLAKDVNQRQFILTRLVEMNGQIEWGFNLPAVTNHVRDVMEFPNFGRKFEKPTLFLGGELSNYLTEKDKPSIEKYFSNYSLRIIPKAGHVIHFDNPSDTIKEISQFLN